MHSHAARHSLATLEAAVLEEREEVVRFQSRAAPPQSEPCSSDLNGPREQFEIVSSFVTSAAGKRAAVQTQPHGRVAPPRNCADHVLRHVRALPDHPRQIPRRLRRGLRRVLHPSVQAAAAARRAAAARHRPLLSESPLVCVQSLDSAARSLVCHHCARPAASLEAEFALAARSHRRTTLLSASPPPLPPLPALAGVDARTSLTCCERRCGAVWCSAACRERDAAAHDLLCDGGLPDGHPLRELRRSASAGGETVLVVARAVARAVAALNELSAAVLNDEAADSAANELRALAPPWWTRNDDAARARQREALTEHASEPWQLLRAGLRAATLRGGGNARGAAPRLRDLCGDARRARVANSCAACARGAARRLLPPPRPRRRRHPDPRHARAARATSSPVARRADAGACRRRWRGAARCVAGDGGGGCGGGGAAGRGRARDRRRRGGRASAGDLLSQRAAATFEPAAFLALLPRCSSLRHSCVPNAQLEPAWPDAGGPLVATLVALRDVPAGEPLTIAWVDCAQPRAAREAALRARFGADYTCGCPRCRYEAAGARPRRRAAAVAASRARGDRGGCSSKRRRSSAS